MSGESVTENKFRQRNQRQAFYMSQLKTIQEKEELPNNVKTVSTQISAEFSSPTQRFEDKMDALKDAIVENIQKHIAEPIQVAVTKFLQEALTKRDVTHKTFQSVYTQTTHGATERGVLGEVEESVIDTTEPRALFLERTHANIESSRRTAMIKHHEEDNPYDNFTPKAPLTSEFGSYSLQIREKLVAVKPRPKSAIEVKTESCDERECLANALQFHVEDLVDGIIFHESELPDCLLAEGCLTEDECASVRKLRDRKDQIRVLLSLIKGRDLRVLKDFMKHIEQHNEEVARKIIEKFEDNKRAGIRRKLCFLCQLKKQFNVKHLVDSLWAVEAIDDGLYNEVIYSEAPLGAQETLWEKVINSINCLDNQKAELAHGKLLKALTGKNLFTHLADGIQKMLIRNHAKLTCSCEPKLILPSRTSYGASSTSEESFFPDSSSDGTSNDIGSSSGIHSRNIPFMRYDVPLGRFTEATEDPLTPSRIALGADSSFEDSIPQERIQPDLNSQTFSKTPVSDGVPDYVNKTTIDAAKPYPRMKPAVPKKPVRAQTPECSK
ncbi:uncharacterized protein LOC123530339 [Mercenaria mercenaria]|uniref:uncharacterized protein LOC123530339 n=1 Tax=Mercenaria mercenaria TaxID=6596 RepID=UPI00234E69B2|nr:uncharacterized protein LOC123530339 [Mercenaria mercenaria]